MSVAGGADRPHRAADGARPFAVRCDGDERTGAGHVARCLPIAIALRDHGWRPVLVGRYAGLARWLVARAGVEAREPADRGPCGLEPGEWRAAIVDLYGADERQLCALAERLQVATIAEASRCPVAGMRIDYHLDRLGAAPSARELPGPAFAPLDPSLPTLRRRAEREVRTALVATGGSRAARQVAGEAVAALRSAFPAVRVLVGSGISAREGVEALPFPGTLHDAIAQADIAVSAGGLTAYELACAGVPAVLVGVADNQARVLEGSRAAGTAIVAAPGRPVSEAVAHLADRETRAQLAAKGARAFDGAGAPRVAAILDRAWRGAEPFGVVLRPAVPGDSARLLAWRNDPLTREASFSGGHVVAREHERWLARTLRDPARRLYVAEEAGTPVGQVRLDRDGQRAEVSITVAPEARGRGVGAAMLAAADTAAAGWGLTCLEARVKPSNERSLRLFRSARYADQATAPDGARVLRRRL